MNSYLLRNLSGITSASIEKYLLFTGWVRDDTFNSTRMWVFKSKSDPEFKIAVPASEKATDFYPQVYNLIQTLSVVDGKTEQEIIDSLKSAYTDRLQFRIITEESQGGKLPLDYAARCLVFTLLVQKKMRSPFVQEPTIALNELLKSSSLAKHRLGVSLLTSMYRSQMKKTNNYT